MIELWSLRHLLGKVTFLPVLVGGPCTTYVCFHASGKIKIPPPDWPNQKSLMDNAGSNLASVLKLYMIMPGLSADCLLDDDGNEVDPFVASEYKHVTCVHKFTYSWTIVTQMGMRRVQISLLEKGTPLLPGPAILRDSNTNNICPFILVHGADGSLQGKLSPATSDGCLTGNEKPSSENSVRLPSKSSLDATSFQETGHQGDKSVYTECCSVM